MNKMVRIPMLNRSIRVAYVFLFSLILVGSIGAYAASVTINTTTNAGYQGNYVVDNGYFSASAISYNVVESAQSATTQPMTWANGGVAYVAKNPGSRAGSTDPQVSAQAVLEAAKGEFAGKGGGNPLAATAVGEPGLPLTNALERARKAARDAAATG